MQNDDYVKKLITIHKNRLQVLKEQKALKGINTEPEILMEIEIIEAELEKLKVDQLASSDLTQVIKQMVPAEPGWYIEDKTQDGYDYHRVLFWILLEESNGHKTWQRLTGVTRFAINEEIYFSRDDRAVYLPQINVQYTSKKKKTIDQLTMDTLWSDEHSDAEAELTARILDMIQVSDNKITGIEIAKELNVREDVANYMLDWTRELKKSLEKMHELKKLAEETGQDAEKLILDYVQRKQANK